MTKTYSKEIDFDSSFIQDELDKYKSEFNGEIISNKVVSMFAYIGHHENDKQNSVKVKLVLNVREKDHTSSEEPIDIYAPEGTKVKYTGKGGYDHHKEHANKYLKIGRIYTIDHTVVSGFHTDVYLKEVPNEAFNSVHFVNEEQCELK